MSQSRSRIPAGPPTRQKITSLAFGTAGSTNVLHVVRLIGGGLVRSVRSMTWSLDPARQTEGSHLTFLQFEDGSAASMAFSGYDYFDSDEFHFWIGESGEEKTPNAHGRTRAANTAVGDTAAEAALKAAKKHGARIITIDPKRTQAAQMADLWLAPRIGTDAALALAMINVTIADGLYDKAFVARA